MNKTPLEPSENDVFRRSSINEVIRLRKITSNPNFEKKCDEFLKNIIPGDEIMEFCTSENSWSIGAGRYGYQIVREGVIHFELLVRMN